MKPISGKASSSCSRWKAGKLRPTTPRAPSLRPTCRAGRAASFSTCACPIDEAGWLKRFATLTEREKEIIVQVAAGRLNREIGERLGISEKTVHIHRQSAYKKLDAHNVADLAPLTVLIERDLIPVKGRTAG